MREIVWPACYRWGDIEERNKIRNYLKKEWTEKVGTHHVKTTLDSVTEEKELILRVS